MKANFIFTLLIGILMISISSAFAQEETKDQRYMIHEEVAKVNMLHQYEKTSAEWVELMHEGKLDIPVIHASQSDDFHYYYLIPIDSYGDIDKLHPKFAEVSERVGKERWLKMYQENEASIESHKEYIVLWSADLSYVAKEPRLKPGEEKFLHWVFFHYKLDKRKEVMGVIKEWKKLYEEKNISSEWSVWIPEIGLDNNLIILTEIAKDGADFYNTMKEISNQIKEEEQKLWAKLSPNIIKIAQKYGGPRPDLSYIKK